MRSTVPQQKNTLYSYIFEHKKVWNFSPAYIPIYKIKNSVKTTIKNSRIVMVVKVPQFHSTLKTAIYSRKSRGTSGSTAFHKFHTKKTGGKT